MAIHTIRLLGDEVLRARSDEVEDFGRDLTRLVADMWETMYHAEGVGLAAPQIGILQRIIVVDVREDGDMQRMALVNPVIVDSGVKKEKGPEGCLSIPGLEELVERSLTVLVEGFNPFGEPLMLEASGLFARALQHEIDHLDGILFLDRVSPLKRKMLMSKWRKSRDEA